MAADASRLTLRRRLTEEERWNIVEKLLTMRDPNTTNLLKKGAVTELSKETGVTTKSITALWRSFCWKTAVTGKPDVTTKEMMGRAGRKPKFSTEELKRRLDRIPVGERSSLSKIAEKSGLTISQVRKAAKLGILESPSQLGQTTSSGNQQQEEDDEEEDFEYGEEEEEEEGFEDNDDDDEPLPGTPAAFFNPFPKKSKYVTVYLVEGEEFDPSAFDDAPAPRAKQPKAPKPARRNTQKSARSGNPVGNHTGATGEGVLAAAAPGDVPVAGAGPSTSSDSSLARRSAAGGFLNLLRQEAGLPSPAGSHPVE